MSANISTPATILWKNGAIDLQRLCRALCFGDALFVTPLDQERARQVLDGKIFFRKRLISANEWASPPNLEPGLHGSWKFYYHSLVWIDPLRRCYNAIPDNDYLDKLLTELDFWLSQFGTPPDRLPTTKDPGDYTWYDMSVGWRTLIIIGALSLVGRNEQLIKHLEVHAAILCRDDFYAGVGNHALHQSDALLSAALVLNRKDYFTTAIERLRELRKISIDNEGVSLEGAPAYHLFNLFWWQNTDRRLALVSELAEAVDIPTIPDMRPFLRYAIAPDGKIIPLGDTTLSSSPFVNIAADKYPAEFIRYLESDVHLNFVMTRGLSGEPLPETMKVFEDGYWFSRGGDPNRRPEEQSHASLRFGPGMSTRVHAHDDAGSITFYPRGIRVIEDGGLFGYYGGAEREFVKSNIAHNGIIVSGRKYYRSATSKIEKSSSSGHFDQATVKVEAIEKTSWHRIVAHAPNYDFIFVQDHVTTTGAAFQQQFNLGDGFEIVGLQEGRVDASNGKANISLIWLNPKQRIGLAKGQTNPLRGWRSTFEGELHPINCVFAATEAGEAERTAKLAVVVILLRPEESFGQIAVDNVSFGSKETKFRLRRLDSEFGCRINLSGDSQISVVATVER